MKSRIKECVYCEEEFIPNNGNGKHCSENCYNLAKRCRKYNLSYSQHQTLRLIKKCQICNSPLGFYNYNEKKRNIESKHCIDHCHVTGKIRGVLCDDCNRGLGAFKDDICVLKSAIEYLSSDTTQLKIVKLMKEAYNRNWITAKDGNISFLENNILYITPSGVRKHELTPDKIIKIPIVNGKPQLKSQKVSIEFKMHWLIQKYQKGGAVIHFHPTQVVAAMLAKIKLKDIHSYFPELNRFTQVGECVDIIFPGEDKLAKETLKNIIGFDIVGLKSHGVTSRGKTLEDAFEHIERLDHCCQMALSAGAFTEI